MLCREVPLSTLRGEAELLVIAQMGEGERLFAEGALAALHWLLDPGENPPPHALLLLRGPEALQ